MDHAISQKTLDEIVSLLAADRKDHALLVYYRAGSVNLEEAWKGFRQLLADLGEKAEDQPAVATKDPTYHQVNYYLTTTKKNRIKTCLWAAGGSLALLALAFTIFSINGPTLITSIRSSFWPTGDATITKVRVYSKSKLVQTRKMTRDFMDFTYQYQAEGQTYNGAKIKYQYYDTFGDKPFSVGDAIQIAYNPKNPGFSVYDPPIYRPTLALSVGFILLLAGLALAALKWSEQRDYGRLKHFDNNRGG